MSRPALADRPALLARLLLLAYPRAFRTRYRDEIILVLHRQRLDAAARGIGPVRFWLAALRDALPSATRVRLAARRTRPPAQRRRHRLSLRTSLDAMFQDIRYALRSLIESPGFTLLSIVLLTLGIGANAAIFTLVSAYVLRPYPYHQPERLFTLHSGIERMGIEFGQFSVPDYLDLRDSATGFEGLALWRFGSYNVAGGETALRIPSVDVSANFFDVLGVEPLLGRTFVAGEDRPGTRDLVLSEGTWRGDFGGDPEIIGRELLLDNEAHLVVGVIPAGTEFPERRKLWRAHLPEPGDDPRYRRINAAIGRLSEGASAQDARSRLGALAAQMQAAYPDSNRGVEFTMQPLRNYRIGSAASDLTILLAAVGSLLLIVCVNVASLQLVRADRRRHEFAVRSALGAGRGRILRQLLAESALLAAVGAMLGVGLGYVAVRAIVGTFPQPLSPWYSLVPDTRVLLFIVAVAGVAVIGSGLLPAIRASGDRAGECLKAARASAVAASGQRHLLSILMTVEVALSVLLLVGSGLTMRSFARVRAVDPGFNPERALSVSLAPPNEGYDVTERILLFEQVEDRLRALPGVAAVGSAAVLPLTGTASTSVQSDLQSDDEARENPEVQFYPVTPGYFSALEIPLLSGRDFTRSDRGDEAIVIVSEGLARLSWGDEDPVGRRLRQTNSDWMRVVGVVADVLQAGIDQPAHPQMYLPHAQEPWRVMAVVLRAIGDPRALADAVRQEIREVDPALAAYGLMTLDDALYAETYTWRFTTMLVWVFGVIALLLAATGLYAVISYAVARRTREFGLRMALGAGPGDVVRLVAGDGGRVVAAGAVLGLLCAAAMSRWIASILYETNALDPPTYGVVAAVLTVVALAAALAPAYRAARLDPLTALRDE